MTKPEIAQEPQTQAYISLTTNSEALADLKKIIDENKNPSFLCTTLKSDNPNYLAIMHANSAFCTVFESDAEDLIGRSYDFLFDNIDVNYSSEDQLEYIRLVKSIKDLHECSIVTKLTHRHEGELQNARFKINFTPFLDKENRTANKKYYAIFTFEKLNNDIVEDTIIKTQNQQLVKNLERALHSEKLLREISYLIISDQPVKDIAQAISKSLVQHLKVDRCVIHDYKNNQSSFIVEHCNPKAKPIIDGSKEALQEVNNYINFQNNFYKKLQNSQKNSDLFIADDIHLDHSFEPIHAFCNKFSITSQIAAITSFDDQINGGIYIHQSEKRTWTIDEIELIEMITDQLAIAIDRSNSIEKVMIANHNLLEKTLELKEAVKKEKALRKIQSEFVALVSHEFKTPLQIIDSTRELILRKLKSVQLPDDSFEKYLERIKSGIQRMNGLITSTLNLAKIEAGNTDIKVEKQNFDLHHLILDIIDKNSNLAANKGIKIVTKFCEANSQINGDQKLLDHCFTNIVSNAIKYSRDNTTVNIVTKCIPDKIAVRIIDHGIGIPADDLQNIGNKFFRAKNTLAVSGTGIGIYLTKYFIDLHKGNVFIKSKIDVGTSVTVVLPRF